MTLALDIGNTRWKLGLFEGNRLVASNLVSDWGAAALVAYGQAHGVRQLVFSSVAGTDEPLLRVLRQAFEVLEWTPETPLPFENRYTTPQTLGKDRLAAVAGVQALWPGRNALVVDCGTCIKYDVLTERGEYLGGNIAPGVQMRSKAMHEFTARLPEVGLEMPSDFVGNSTQTALQNGAFRGAVLEVMGFVGLFQQRFADLQVFLTGGDALFLQPYLSIPHVRHEPDLTLHGLNHILIFNTPTPHTHF